MAQPSSEAPGEDASSVQASEEQEDQEAEVEREDIRAAVLMGVVFVGTIVLAMLIAEALSVEVQPVFEDPEDPTNPLIYLVLVVLFTAVILVVAKLGLNRVIQFGILAAIFFLMVFIYQPMLDAVSPLSSTIHLVASVLLAVVLTALLYYYPEWYVVDAVGISVAAGATGWFGFSFGIVPALVLLIAFAAYDAIAVYRTEHMLDLADQVMGLRLPIMIVIPKTLGYSFLEGDTVTDASVEDEGVEQEPGLQEDEQETGLQENAGEDVEDDDAEAEEGKQKQDALFMGLGDIVIPGVLVVSSMMFLGEHPAVVDAVLGIPPALFVAISTLAGATVGFVFLMRGVLKGSPHAGLPALNGGALVGFLVPLVLLFGVDPLIPVI